MKKNTTERKRKKKSRFLNCAGAVIMSMVMLGGSLSGLAAWDGYTETESDQNGTRISLLDFNNAGAILKSGAMPMKEHTKNGNANSAYWGNQTATKDLYFTDVPKDLSECGKLEIEMYSKKAVGDKFMILFETGTNADGTSNYFYYSVPYDWEGWKKLSIPLTSMTIARSANWKTVARLRFTVNGWGMVPSPEAELYIASMDVTVSGGTSLEILYSEETLEKADEAMKNASLVYGDRAIYMSEDGTVKPIGGGLSSIAENGCVLVPDILFKEEYGAETDVMDSSWTMVMDGTELKGNIGEAEYTANGVKRKFSVCPKTEGERLYLPFAEAAAACGRYTVTDGKLVIVSKEDKIKVFERLSGVNELTEIAAYKAGHIAVDPNTLTEADCTAVKDNWRYLLTGSEEDNDMSNPIIASKIESIAANGKSSWENIIKDAESKELFKGTTTTTSNNMTSDYSKIYNMALAYGTPGSSLYKNEDLRDDILYALEWMHKNRYGYAEIEGTGWRSPRAFNWWDWQIGTPNHLTKIMLIMEEFLTAKQKEDYLALFDYLVPQVWSDGSNKLNIGRSMITSALLQNNPSKVFKVQNQLDDLFMYMDIERPTSGVAYYDERTTDHGGQGFYTDGSYVFHTLHAMNGTYGTEHFAEIGKYITLFKGTAFEITSPQTDNIADWIYNSFEPIIYQGAVFRLMKGRDPTGTHSTGLSILSGMISVLDSLSFEDQARVKSIIKKQVTEDTSVNVYNSLGLTGAIALIKIMEDDSIEPKQEYKINKVYYNEDKVVHQRDDFALSVSMSSSRIFNYECINSQNMTGWYVGDGMVEYNVKGDFLQSSDGYWSGIDPYRLPGTTVDTQERQAVTIAQGNEYLSSKDFVGGVSDGVYGAAAMWLESYHNDEDYGTDGGSYGGKAPKHDCNLQAKKAYFMFDDEMVCLGSDVNASNGYDVLTIIDNRKAVKTKEVSEDVNAAKQYDIIGVVASDTPEAANIAENTIDGDGSTKWAAEANATITWDLGESHELGFAALQFQNGSKRTQKFKLEISEDSNSWTEVFDGLSSGKTESKEIFDLNGESGRYVRFTNYGNSQGTAWVSLAEASFYPVGTDEAAVLSNSGFIGDDKITIDGEETQISENDTSLQGTKWVHLEESGGYYFPLGGNIFARNTVSANKQCFFELWFNHGEDPEGGTYSYVMLPGKTADETEEYAKNPDVEILENTPSLQVVRENKLGITAIVFWEAGSYNGITADKPMMVMVQEANGSYKLSVSDPTHKLTAASVTLPWSLTVLSKDAMLDVATASSSTKININFEESDGRSMIAELKDSGLETSDFSFSGGVSASGELIAGRAVKASVNLKNLTAKRTNAMLYLAAYNNAESLQSICSKKKTLYGLGAGGTVETTVTTDESTAQIKAFLWDTELNIPYCKAAELYAVK